MEHRCSQRVPLNINTLIYKHGVPVAMGRIKNGSGNGLYLETDYQDVRELQKLELEVLLESRKGSNGRERREGRGRHQVSALVVRKYEFGYGLEMEMLSDAGSLKLRAYIQKQVLQQAQSQAQAQPQSQTHSPAQRADVPQRDSEWQEACSSRELFAHTVGRQKNHTAQRRGPYVSPRG